MEKRIQTDRLLKWLEHSPISPKESMERLGIYRLSARIYDLRKRGHNITMKKTNGYGVYSLLSPGELEVRHVRQVTEEVRNED
jgi:hypothetical protein